MSANTHVNLVILVVCLKTADSYSAGFGADRISGLERITLGPKSAVSFVLS